MADDLRPTLPPGFPAAARIDTASPAYQAVHDAAKQGGMTQSQFSDLLGMEARRAMERSGIAGAPVNNMTFAQKMAASEVLKRAQRR